jgi:hypothetical protein
MFVGVHKSEKVKREEWVSTMLFVLFETSRGFCFLQLRLGRILPMKSTSIVIKCLVEELEDTSSN